MLQDGADQHVIGFLAEENVMRLMAIAPVAVAQLIRRSSDAGKACDQLE